MGVSYDAIIFDNDGVLVTPNDRGILEPAVHAAFGDVGVERPPAEQVSALCRGVDPEWLREVCASHEVDPTRFWQRRDARFAQAQRAAIHAGDKGIYDDIGVLEDLTSDHGLGIVSSNQHDTIEFILDHYGLRSRFDTWYGREPTLDSLRKKKPRPHYVERALADLGTENALFVGDNESDIRAAANAGVDSAFIRRPHRVDTDLSVEPTIEIDSLADLV
jgi:HAD superfamily hydrolase (TIGR01549 family)